MARQEPMMDWANERYVRVYTRDTADWRILSWEARGLFLLMLRKVDRSGVLATKHGSRGVAALVEMPLDAVERALPELVGDGCVSQAECGFVIRNYLEAQETTKTDAQRKREMREARRDDASGTVRTRPEVSEVVQTRPNSSESVPPILSEPSLTKPSRARSARIRAQRIAPQQVQVPADWEPSAGVEEDDYRHLVAFRDHHRAKGNVFSDLEAAWRNWKRRIPDFTPRRQWTVDDQLERVRMLEEQEQDERNRKTLPP